MCDDDRICVNNGHVRAMRGRPMKIHAHMTATRGLVVEGACCLAVSKILLTCGAEISHDNTNLCA